MIAIAERSPTTSPRPAWHAAFLALLPAIREQAEFVFKHLRSEAKEDAVAEVICHACIVFRRLVQCGKANAIYPSALVRYAVKQYRVGRRVGSQWSSQDVMSLHCRQQRGVRVERLDRPCTSGDRCWEEIVVEDRNAGPAETAAARIDIGQWFRRLPSRKRTLAQALAIGERTRDVAVQFGLSKARVSQLRDEFRRDWRRYSGEAV